MKLEQKLTCLRKEKGLTQMNVAEALDVSRQAISRWESGAAVPSTENLKTLSKLYEVPIDFLLNEDIAEIPSQGKTEMEGQESRHRNNTRRVRAGIFAVVLVSVILMLIYINRSKEEREEIPVGAMDSEVWDSEGSEGFPMDW